MTKRELELKIIKTGDLEKIAMLCDHKWIIANIAEVNNVALMERALDKGYTFTSLAFDLAAGHNNMQMLELLIARGHYPHSSAYCHTDNMETIKWLHSHGATLDIFAINHAVSKCTITVLEWMLTNYKVYGYNNETLALAAERGDIAIAQLLLDRGFTIDESATYYAAKTNNLQMLKWLYANGAKVTELSVACAARSGDRETLAWLYSNGAPLSHIAMSSAAATCDIQTLQWLYDRGIPIESTLFYNAASNDRLDVIAWAISQGAYPDESAMVTAAKEDNLRVVKYLHSIGVKPSHTTLEIAVYAKATKIIEWLLSI